MCLEKLYVLVAQERKPVITSQNLLLMLAQSLAKYDTTEMTVAEHVKKDVGRKQLFTLMQWVQRADEMAVGEPWGKAELQELSKAGAGWVHTFQQYELEEPGKKLKEQCASLAEIAGGASGQQKWDAGLSENASWEQVAALAGTTLLDSDVFDANKLADHITDTEEVC